MIGIFGGLKSFIDFTKKRDEPWSEGQINRLHYGVTTTILFGCTLLVTAIEWIGNDSKISCLMEGSEDSWTIPSKVINTYCYITTTFTLPEHYNSKVGHDAVSVGVGNYGVNSGDVTYKAYYQWVPFVLFLQGILFYFPHCLHKAWEGGKVKNIMSGLHNLIIKKSDRLKREKILANYVLESLNTHNLWAVKILLVDLINLINVVFNIFFVDFFLGEEFSTYGIKVIEFLEADPEKRIDPMAVVFPRVTKCTFHKFGPSGTVQHRDSLCVLPINIINEKIYVFLWFWFIVLSAISLFGFIYSFILTLSPAMTKLAMDSRAVNQKGIRFDEIGKKCQVGDWKLLFILSKNMDPHVFGEFLRQLHSALKKSKKRKYGSEEEDDI